MITISWFYCYEPRNQSARTSNSDGRGSKPNDCQRRISTNDLSRRVSRLTCLLRRHVTPWRKHDRESRFAILRPTPEFGGCTVPPSVTRSRIRLCLPTCLSGLFFPPVGTRVASRFFFVFFFFTLYSCFSRSWERSAVPVRVDRQPRRFGSGANAPYLDVAQT